MLKKPHIKLKNKFYIVFVRNVQFPICHEIGDYKFFLIVDEARDKSKSKQIAFITRFVDRSGFIREWFFDIIHVKNTIASTLKKKIFFILFHHNLDVQNIRGQRYDGANNIYGEWNGLQAFFINDCLYAYYLHCLACQLQLALIVATKEVCNVNIFFQNFIFIVNTVSASFYCHNGLRAFKQLQLNI